MPGLVCQVIKKRNCDKIRIQINSLYQEWWNPPSLKLRNGERELARTPQQPLNIEWVLNPTDFALAMSGKICLCLVHAKNLSSL